MCTCIGALPGAGPPLIGWAAARGCLDTDACLLFTIVFLWQFPHFMAIAWIYREDYARAGYFVLPANELKARFDYGLPGIDVAVLGADPTLSPNGRHPGVDNATSGLSQVDYGAENGAGKL